MSASCLYQHYNEGSYYKNSRNLHLGSLHHQVLTVGFRCSVCRTKKRFEISMWTYTQTDKESRPYLQVAFRAKSVLKMKIISDLQRDH